MVRVLIHPDGQVELQAPVPPMESPDTTKFHQHDFVQSMHRIDPAFKGRVEELCALGLKPKQIMQQLLQDGTLGELDKRVEKQVIGVRKRFFACRTPDGRTNTTSHSDLLRWFAQIEVHKSRYLAPVSSAPLLPHLSCILFLSYLFLFLIIIVFCVRPLHV